MSNPNKSLGDIFERVRFMLAWSQPVIVVCSFYTDEHLEWLAENLPHEWQMILVALADFEMTTGA